MPCALRLSTRAAISAGVGFSCIQCRRIHKALSPLSNAPPFTSAPVAAAMAPMPAAAMQRAPSNTRMAAVGFEVCTIPSPEADARAAHIHLDAGKLLAHVRIDHFSAFNRSD